jgi:hypothetical protein
MLQKVKTVDKPYALLVAANRNDVTLARALLDRQAPIDGRAIDGSTAVSIAAASGHADMLRLLIGRGANVRLSDDYGDTALMNAVRAGSLQSVRLLLDAGADVNHQDKAGRTALIWAARSGRLEIVRVLLTAGADINLTAADGHTALTAAVRQRQFGAARLLRARQARGNTTALPMPSVRAAVELSLPLLQRGAANWVENAKCSSCHHQGLILRVTALARSRGLPIDLQMLDSQLQRLRGQDARIGPRVREILKSDEYPTGELRIRRRCSFQ